MSRYSVQRRTREEQVGPELYHVYEITNGGPSEIVSAEAVILWPTYTLPEGQPGPLQGLEPYWLHSGTTGAQWCVLTWANGVATCVVANLYTPPFFFQEGEETAAGLAALSIPADH